MIMLKKNLHSPFKLLFRPLQICKCHGYSQRAVEQGGQVGTLKGKVAACRMTPLSLRMLLSATLCGDYYINGERLAKELFKHS